MRIAKLEEAAIDNGLDGSKKSDLNIGNVLEQYSIVLKEFGEERESGILSPSNNREVRTLVTMIEKLFSSMVTEATLGTAESETNSEASVAVAD